MHYLVYQTTNTVNGKIYVGVHQTEDLNDGYMGSGVVVNSAFKKYGDDAFIRDILHSCADEAEMFAHEARIVNEAFVARHDTYNLQQGGRGGSKGREVTAGTRRKLSEAATGEKHHMFGKKHTEATRRKMSASHSGEKNHRYGKTNSAKTRRKISEGQMGRISPMKGKVPTAEHRRKLSEAMRGKRHTLEAVAKMAASMSRLRWINNPTTGKKKRVTPDKIDLFTVSGWKLGRGPRKVVYNG